jgi:hypothetical protein
MTLFLDGIFDESRVSPSSVNIKFPVRMTGTREYLTGLLISEPTISSQNKWGPILSDITNIQDVASLLGSEHMWSWIGASVMCWKGTDPVKTTVEFYLINYKKNLRIEEKLKDLNYLTSLYDEGKNISVGVHGGYKARVLETNRTHFNNGLPKREGKMTSREYLERALGDYKLTRGDESWQNMEEGTIAIQFGNKMVLRNMLIGRLNVTPSIVEVPDGKPLYYRVSMDLTGSRPLLSTDVDDMYNSGTSLFI